MKRLHNWSLILLALIGCQTTSPNPEELNGFTHVLRLECVGGNAPNLQSRIGALDTNNPIYDFALVAGHAVPVERPCVVKDFFGRKSNVSLIRLADGYKSGEDTDWAIIRFKKIKTPNLVRYPLEPFEINGPLNEIRVRFAQAFALPENTQDCRLTTLEFPNNTQRISHDCRAIAGQSGSPLTTIVDGKHKLVGLHVGHLWMLDSPETRRPDRKGYINVFTSDMVADIKQVIARNSN